MLKEIIKYSIRYTATGLIFVFCGLLKVIFFPDTIFSMMGAVILGLVLAQILWKKMKWYE